MTDDGLLEYRIADHYEREAPGRAPGWVLDAVLAAVETTRQQRGRLGVPWRSRAMVEPTPRVRSRVALITAVAVLLTLLVVTAITPGARLADQMPPERAVDGVDKPLPISPMVGGTFSPAGNLMVARSKHVAVLLADGRVLVLGGDSLEDRWLLPSELYDPRTGTSTVLDDPGLARGPADDDGFTATLLDDGRVLIAGGWDGNNFVDPPWTYERAASLFDPATGTTTPTGPLNVGRAGHVAARLSGGRILVIGGTGVMTRTEMQNLTSAEIYDPRTETFSPTGPMSCSRTRATLQDLSAIVLPSGRVLVTGGEDSSTCRGDEIYDPATGRFSAAQAVGAREDVPNVILGTGGRVYRYHLVSGTATDITPGPSADVERVLGPDCRDHDWDCRGGLTATTLGDGRVLLAGGWTTTVGPDSSWANVETPTAEVLDPATGMVVSAADLIQPRRVHTATLLPDSRVLLIGGEERRTNCDGLSSCEDPDVVRVLFSSVEIFTPE